MDSVGGNLESLKSFPIHDIRGTTLVDKDPGNHEVCDNDGDYHRVILVDEVDILEVPIHESDRRETLL